MDVFLSYARADHFFADLAESKLAEHDVRIWRDSGRIRPGDEWRTSIDVGISKCQAVLVALSEQACQSSYVTYEWSYALGKGKPLIPIKLSECDIHPRLSVIQHLDFSSPHQRPWSELIERINDVELDTLDTSADDTTDAQGPMVRAILKYLDQRGYTMVSFERLNKRVNEALTEADWEKILYDNPHIFRSVTLKGGRKGLGKRIP